MDSYTIQDIQFQENVLRKGEAMIIGAVGGIIVVLAIALLEKLKLDDPVGAIAVHLFAEIAFETVRVDFAEKLFEGSNADFQVVDSNLMPMKISLHMLMARSISSYRFFERLYDA